jgi:hypothetical protein
MINNMACQKLMQEIAQKFEVCEMVITRINSGETRAV